MKKKYSVSLMILTLLLAMPISSLAMTAKSTNLLTYNVSLTSSGGGQLYWNYGKNLEFFLINGNDTYNQNCLIKSKVNYNFSALVDRGIIARPDEGWYFDGFYDRVGCKRSMDIANIHIIRVSVKGLYYYDYVYSIDNRRYARYSKNKYDDTIKAYLKSSYGTSRYKILATTQLYPLPKNDWDLYPHFKAKLPQKITVPKSIFKSYGDLPFRLSPEEDSGMNLSYKSSNTRVLSVNKSTGLGTIKGEGCATVTITAIATDTALATEAKVKIYVNPVGIRLISVSKSRKGEISLKWTPDSKCTGYQTELDHFLFYLKPYQKTIISAKKSSAKIKPPTKQVYNYARIRAFKKSAGVNVYGPWSESLPIK